MFLGENYFINFSYFLYFIAFSLRDMLWLRMMVIMSCLSMVVYGVLSNIPTMIAWNLAFLLINGIQVIMLLLERRPVDLEEDMEKIYLTVFRALTRKEFLRLWEYGDERVVTGQSLSVEGEGVGHLMFIRTGKAEVFRKDAKLAELGDMQFVGEMSFLNASTAGATVKAAGEVLLHRWSHAQIGKLKHKWPAIHEKLLLILGQDLTRKINR
ncbi:cyclic nucleotide-binding domain-containing protein [bacterium]|nr:cyclic nucleotide-binding domain-containing protein [bacterium]